MADKPAGSDRLRGVLPSSMFAELQSTAQQCYARGLFQASRWAAEMAAAMDATAKNQQPPITSAPSDPVASLPLLHLAARDLPQALSTSEKLTSLHGRFLHLYCRYMEGEQRRTAALSVEDIIAGKTDQGNPHLLSIRRDLEAIPKEHRDPFILFLYGAVLARLEQREKAVEALVASVHRMPCNIAAWQELIAIYRVERTVSLPLHWMSSVFEALLFLEMRHGDRALNALLELSALFPRSVFLMSTTAVAYYMMRKFTECEALFEKQVAMFPKRIDHLDTFSNQLHVQQKLPRLAQLAQQVQEVAPYRPETCCIVGNFYSLRGEHEKALGSFLQALKFNRRFCNAWLLLGHEFAEIRHTNGAAQAYHKALALNPYEYRAWFGLGQIFTTTPRIAVFYFMRAARLKPADQRLWCTLGLSLASADKPPSMIIAALERAPEMMPAAQKLRELYALLNNKAKAEEWQKRVEALAAAEAEEAEAAEGEEEVEGEDE